jgi:murein DD-endopeptidase MepM/ murein hydrolase activator NlpD
VIGLLVLVAAIAGIAAMAPGRGASSTPGGASSVASDTAAAPSAPTPAFASFRKTQLLLPVPAEAITVIAFHQSSYSDTYVMTPIVAIGTIADAKAAADAQRASGAPPTPRTGPQADAAGVWTGSALEVWRTNVNGRMGSALDCGAQPGTPVFAPLTGTVMRIRSYKLYRKYPDYEIQIRPDAWNDVDLIILHVSDPVVSEGQHVIAGVTQVASVRDLASTVSGLQLRSYTTEGGNHTHVQLTKIPKPDETWQYGQDPPGFVRKGS